MFGIGLYYFQAQTIEICLPTQCFVDYIHTADFFFALVVYTGDIAVSEAVVFRENSNYGRGSVQFTLTCISSGGPATNVTWTRNSEAVTDGMRTVLNDSVNAIYTHTLTVTGRLGGHYKCTVSNNKPSSDSSSIVVQGEVFVRTLSLYMQYFIILYSCI